MWIGILGRHEKCESVRILGPYGSIWLGQSVLLIPKPIGYVSISFGPSFYIGLSFLMSTYYIPGPNPPLLNACSSGQHAGQWNGLVMVLRQKCRSEGDPQHAGPHA